MGFGGHRGIKTSVVGEDMETFLLFCDSQAYREAQSELSQVTAGLKEKKTRGRTWRVQ